MSGGYTLSGLSSSFIILVLLGHHFARCTYFLPHARQAPLNRGLLTCYDCGDNKDCLHQIKAGTSGKCYTKGVCFIRRDPNGLIYRGCADHKIWPRALSLKNIGCGEQNYGEWSQTRPNWCFCNQHLCNYELGFGGRPRPQPQPQPQPQPAVRIYDRSRPVEGRRLYPQVRPRLERITFYKPRVPPYPPVRYPVRPAQDIEPRWRYVDGDGRRAPLYEQDVDEQETNGINNNIPKPTPRPYRPTPTPESKYEVGTPDGTPEGRKAPKYDDDDYENVMELLQRLLKSPKDAERLPIVNVPKVDPAQPNNRPKQDLEGLDDNHTCENMKCEHACRIVGDHPACTCPMGFQLLKDERNCEEINECEFRNGGCKHMCNNTIGSYFCSCEEGFVLDADKKTCNDFNECMRKEDNNCQHGCRNKAPYYVCECPRGYMLNADGKTCDDIDECKTNKHKCDDQCLNTEGSYKCACNHGYYLGSNGRTCRDTNECTENNGGCKQKCENTAGTFKCYCDDGYILNVDGITCDDVNECLVNNGGCEHDCENTIGSYQCRCRTGFELDVDQHKCRDINECKVKNGGCDHNCENMRGSYKCSCRSGYTLNVDSRSCDAKNKCNENNGGCDHICSLVSDEVRCSCRPGFMLVNGYSCADIDECTPENADCDGGCFNTIGAYECFCSPGFILNRVDWRTCDDVNECNTNNGRCSQTCSNTLGSYRCECGKGYQLNVDKRTCDDINECRVNRGGCDQQCVNTPGSFQCTCNTGYRRDERQGECVDINECLINNGGCDQLCTNTVGSFTCSCNRILFKLHTNGRTCEATCPDDFIKVDEFQSCYKVFTPKAGDGTSLSAPQAQLDCKNQHERAGLVSIQTPLEQRFLSNILKEESREKKDMLEGWQGWWTSGVWQNGINTFKWSDRSDIALDSPYWGFQKQPYTDTCVWVLQISVYNQTWGNYDCLTQSGYICEIELPK